MAPSNRNRREPVICAECGAENRPSRFFCGSCGAYLRSDEDTWEGESVTSTYRTDPLPPADQAPPGSTPARKDPTTSAPGSGAAEPQAGSSGQEWLEWERSEPTRRAARQGIQVGDSPKVPLRSPIFAANPPVRRGHSRNAGVLAAVFLLVAVVALFALVYSALTSEPSGEVATGDQTTTTEAAGGTDETDTTGGEQAGGGEEQPTSTTTTQISENPDPVNPTDMEVSSQLESEQGISYAPHNVIDDDLATSWQEGAEGSGEGEWLRFRFDSPVTLVRMEIANGYQKDERRYFGNARPRTIRIEYSDGSSQMAQLVDEQGYQSLPLAPKGTETLTFTIESVYPGNLWEDMAVSEIRLYAAAE
jgi:hypothetical protein